MSPENIFKRMYNFVLVKRNAMGEYIPGEDEKALTQQGTK